MPLDLHLGVNHILLVKEIGDFFSATTTLAGQHVVQPRTEVPLLHAETSVMSRVFIILTNLPVC